MLRQEIQATCNCLLELGKHGEKKGVDLVKYFFTDISGKTNLTGSNVFTTLSYSQVFLFKVNNEIRNER
jgi:hypothetical protein